MKYTYHYHPSNYNKKQCACDGRPHRLRWEAFLVQREQRHDARVILYAQNISCTRKNSINRTPQHSAARHMSSLDRPYVRQSLTNRYASPVGVNKKHEVSTGASK